MPYFFIRFKVESVYEAEDRAKRAVFESNVQAADGISEEEAIEIGVRRKMPDDTVYGQLAHGHDGAVLTL